MRGFALNLGNSVFGGRRSRVFASACTLLGCHLAGRFSGPVEQRLARSAIAPSRAGSITMHQARSPCMARALTHCGCWFTHGVCFATPGECLVVSGRGHCRARHGEDTGNIHRAQAQPEPPLVPPPERLIRRGTQPAGGTAMTAARRAVFLLVVVLLGTAISGGIAARHRATEHRVQAEPRRRHPAGVEGGGVVGKTNAYDTSGQRLCHLRSADRPGLHGHQRPALHQRLASLSSPAPRYACCCCPAPTAQAGAQAAAVGEHQFFLAQAPGRLERLLRHLVRPSRPDQRPGRRSQADRGSAQSGLPAASWCRKIREAAVLVHALADLRIPPG